MQGFPHVITDNKTVWTICAWCGTEPGHSRGDWGLCRGGHFCRTFVTARQKFCPELCVVVCRNSLRTHILFKVIFLCIFWLYKPQHQPVHQHFMCHACPLFMRSYISSWHLYEQTPLKSSRLCFHCLTRISADCSHRRFQLQLVLRAGEPAGLLGPLRVA